MGASLSTFHVPLPRHTPPTGAPLSWSAWRAGLMPSAVSVAAFEDALAAYLRVDACFTAASGRTALYLLLNALRELPELAGRHEVVLPGYTCPSVAKVVLDAGYALRLVDQDPQTLTFRPDDLDEAVDEQTLAVVVVHPFGLAVDVSSVLQVARRAGAFVIEDVAQSMGAASDGRPLGTLGDAGLFSFGPGKPLSLGGGGLIATSNSALAEALSVQWASLPPITARAAALKANTMNWLRLGLFNLAFRPSLWWWATRLGAQKVGENEANWGYRLSRLTSAQASVGMELLPQLDAANNWRMACARALTGALIDLPALMLPRASAANPRSIYLRFPLLTATPDQAEALYTQLWQAGHGAGRMYRHALDHFFPQADAESSRNAAVLSGSKRIAATLVTLPTHHYLSASDLVEMGQIIASIHHEGGPTA